jgi:hypothetical protein
MDSTTAVDYVAWAKRANARWIVHHNLSRNAEAYLGHLAQRDERRLLLSCRNAYLMVWLRDSMDDPKPWFYSGLFSLTTPIEADRFLANHWLTRTLADRGDQSSLENLKEITREKLQRIQEAMAKLPESFEERTV